MDESKRQIEYFNRTIKEMAEDLKEMASRASIAAADIKQAVTEAVADITKGHEATLTALGDAAIYHSFIDSITVEDLRSVDSTEKSISSFLKATHREKAEAINRLPIFIVYRLYENKEKAGTLPSPTSNNGEADKGYNGTERLYRRLEERLNSLRSQGIKPIQWQQKSAEFNNAEEWDLEQQAEEGELNIIIDYGMRGNINPTPEQRVE